jgi:elongation factor 1-beta
MWFQGALGIANVVVSFKVFPTGIDVDLNELGTQIETALPQKAKIYARCQTEPIAFGLNALLVHIKFPEGESGILENTEQNITQIPTVSRIQTVMVQRTR